MKERTVFQAAITPELLDKMKKIAAFRGVKMSRVLVLWIEYAYLRLPQEAK
jgi:hypothetical protein